MNKIAVYSAIIDDYDEPHDNSFPGADFFLIRGTGGPRTARRHKIIPSYSYEYIIYLDGSMQLTSPPEALLAHLGDNDIAVFKHPERSCLYDEAEACIRLGKGLRDEISAQVARYRMLGVPENLGLAETGILVRRSTPAVRRFCELWWQEIEQGSYRDQISFPYVMWATGLPICWLPGSGRENPFSKYFGHRKKGKPGQRIGKKEAA